MRQPSSQTGESNDHLAGQESALAISGSPPDYVTYMREHPQAIGGHTNLSYVIDNPVFDSLNEAPPPYSDVFPSESKPDTEICSEPLSNHFSVVIRTVDMLY